MSTRSLDPLHAATFANADAVALFAGPGGMDEANHLLNTGLGIVGVDIDGDAVATARAAGHPRVRADVRDLDPAHLAGVRGLIITPPCPTFSAAGLGSGRRDAQLVLDAITALGTDTCGHQCVTTCMEEGCLHNHWHGEGPDANWRDDLDKASDPRTALVVHGVRMLMRAPDLEWFILEQVPALEPCWEDVAAELYAAGWETVDVMILDAADYGAGARRRRAFAWGRRTRPLGGSVTAPPCTPVAAATILGWPAGHSIRTRNDRRAGGGNDFPTDRPGWCLTGKARTWFRVADGARLDVDDAAALQGFLPGYPWHGSRTSQFQQIGDVVSPIVGAAVLGTVLGLDWQPKVAVRVAALTAAQQGLPLHP